MVIVQGKIEMFKAGNAYLDHIDFYNLLGDPALHLKRPAPFAILPSVYYGNITIDNKPCFTNYTSCSIWIIIY